MVLLFSSCMILGNFLLSPSLGFLIYKMGLTTAALEVCCKDWEDYTRSFLLMHSEGNLAHCNHLINVELLLNLLCSVFGIIQRVHGHGPCFPHLKSKIVFMP